MKVNKGNIIVILILFIIIAQICLPMFSNVSYAVSDGWDISISDNGNIIAKLDQNGTLSIIGKGSMKNWDCTSEIYAPWYEVRNEIKTIYIEEGITTIGKYAFADCNELTSIILPKGIMSIGSFAFLNCSSLVEIEISEQVTSLGDGTFSGCTSLENIILSKGMTKIGSNTFKNCINLKNIIIPEGIREIGYTSFESCESLENVIIPNGVTNIHSEAFVNCNNLNIICNSGSNAETYAKEQNKNYVIDDEKPEIIFTTEESNTNLQKANITVEAIDNLVGVDESSLKYLWTTKSSNIEINQIVTGFKNGDTILNDNLTGRYYLWVVASDKLGNYTIQNTPVCSFDNTLPTITVNQTTSNGSELTITVADLGEGLDNSNNYQYYVSTSETSLLEGTWETYSSGLPITIQEGRTEEYYVFIKTISDKAGNVSCANGTMLTIDGNTYHRFGPYTRNVEAVTFTPDGSQAWENSTNVKVSGLGNNISENYKYAWIKSDSDIEIGDSANELNSIEFEVNDYIEAIAYNSKTENGKYCLVVIEKETNTIIAKTNEFYFTTDIVAPNVNILYSNIEETRDIIEVQLTADEEIQAIEGWKLSEDKKKLTKIYKEAIEETVIIKDVWGNETEQIIKIEAKPVEETITKGDINNDGTVNFIDIILVNKARLGEKNLEGKALLAADVTEDGQVDMKDIIKINKYILNKISEL